MKLVGECKSIQFVHTNWWLCKCGDYPEHSVLAGQFSRQLCTAYDSKEEAVAANPGVQVEETYIMESGLVPSCAPLDFDPGYCGESWEEPS